MAQTFNTMNLEEKILWLGYDFRDVTFHSSGKYSCRLFQGAFIKRKPMEFWGKTPNEAIDQAIQYIKSKEPID